MSDRDFSAQINAWFQSKKFPYEELRYLAYALYEDFTVENRVACWARLQYSLEETTDKSKNGGDNVGTPGAQEE